MPFIGASIGELASQAPHLLALSCGDRHWSRAELQAAILERAALWQNDIRHGSRVALFQDTPADLLIAFFAVVRLGGIAMVCDPEWPEARKHWVVAESQADVTITAANLVVTRQSDQRAESASSAIPPADAFYVGFTSGSTGTPKGYMRSHQSWFDSFDLSRIEFSIGEADKIIVPGNMVHSLHLYGAVHGLCVGSHVVVFEKFVPRRVASHLREHPSLVLYGTPTQLHFIQAELAHRSQVTGKTHSKGDTGNGRADGVRLVLASGAKWATEVRAQMVASFPKADLVEFYGASETSFITISHQREDVPKGSVGRAVAGVTLDIRDEAGQSLPAGTTGDIWVQSSLLFMDYICGGGEEIRRTGDWMTVGDQGLLDATGFLHLAGRKKRMAVTSGVNVYPEEVEQALLAHPAVALAAVVAVPHPVRGQVLIACVVPEKASEAAGTASRVSEKALTAHCLKMLNRSALPRAYHVMAELPLTAGGKIDLQKLTRRFEETNDDVKDGSLSHHDEGLSAS